MKIKFALKYIMGQEAKSEKCPRKVKTERGLYMKRSRSFGKGLIAGIVIWLFIILADAIDEFVLDVDSFLGINGSLVVLLCMIVAYIVYYIKKKPHWKNILCFFTGYLITGAATDYLECLGKRNVFYRADGKTMLFLMPERNRISVVSFYHHRGLQRIMCLVSCRLCHNFIALSLQ